METKNYDRIVGITIANIYSLTKDKDMVVLKGKFNSKKERYFLVQALAVGMIFSKTVGVKMGIIPFIYKKYIKKDPLFKNLKLNTKRTMCHRGWYKGVDVKQLDEITSGALTDGATFEEIYDTYYNGLY
jgi:hypothetical protein